MAIRATKRPKSEDANQSLAPLRLKPGHLIRRSQQIAVAIFLDETAGFNITPVQYAALVGIRDHDDVDVTKLSSLIAFDRSTLGSVVERLEARDFIRRQARPEDRRTKSLKITAAGRQLLADVEPAVLRAQDRMLAPLPPSQREHFVRLLERFVHINNDASRAPSRRIDPENP